jgi:hypothetical protein
MLNNEDKCNDKPKKLSKRKMKNTDKLKSKSQATFFKKTIKS